MDAPRVQEHRAAGHTHFGVALGAADAACYPAATTTERAVPSMQAIAPNALDRWHEHLALAIRRLRQPTSSPRWSTPSTNWCRSRSSMISLERKGHAPTLLYERGIAERFREAIIRRYFSRGYLLDPFCLAVEEGLPEGFYTLGEIAPDDFFQAPTTRPTTSAPGGGGRLLHPRPRPTEKLSICLYNGLSASRYSDAGRRPRRPAPPVLELARQFCAGRADLSPNPQADLARAPSGSAARLRSRRAHRPRTRGLPPAAQRPLARNPARG